MTLTRLAAALVLAGTAQAASAANIAIACGSIGFDVEICRTLVKEWSAKTGHKAKIFVAPKASNDQLTLYRKQFADKSGELDVMTIDVVWPGMLKDHLLDLTPYAKGVQKTHFASIVANNTVNGKLLAMPWFTEAGLLYYRKDLLAKYKEKLPQTWDELAGVAQRIQDAERKAGHENLVGFVFQGKAYEGLTCDALEWIASHGGSAIDASGKITINSARAAKALDTAASWRGTIAPADVDNFAEEDARRAFQDGDAVFMRNWTYVWNLAQREDSVVKGKIGLAVLPHAAGSKSAATLGGWQLAVSKYSAHPDVAADLVLFLTSHAIQKKRTLLVGSLPTLPALYKDPEVLKAAPYLAPFGEALKNAVARPSTLTGEKYDAVSSAIWTATNAALGGEINGAQAVQQIERDLTRIRHGSHW